MLYIGIDLGTSAVKLLLMDETGKIHNIVSKEYPISFPHPGWSEQNPEDWFAQSMEGMKELIAECDKSQVAGIGFGGKCREDFKHMAKKDEYIGEAYEVLQRLSADELKRLEYETRQKAIRDYNTQMNSAERRGIQQGIEQGRKQGIEQGRRQGAKDERCSIIKKLWKRELP